MFKWLKWLSSENTGEPKDNSMQVSISPVSIYKEGEGRFICHKADEIFSFTGNKSKKELEVYINSRPDCKFISCARAKNSSGFILRFSCALSTISATLPEECHIFIDKYNLSITEKN